MNREDILQEYYMYKDLKNLEKAEIQALDTFLDRAETAIKSDFIKMIKSNSIQTFSYTPDRHYQNKLVHQIVPNCMPCKYVLVLFDEPIIDSFDTFDLLTTKMFIFEKSPKEYDVVQISTAFFRQLGTVRHSVFTLHNTVVMKEAHLETSISEEDVKQMSASSQEDIVALMTMTLASHFMDFNRMLYKAKAEQYLQVDSEIKQKVTFKNYKGQKTSKQIISPSIIYIGSKKDYAKTSYAKAGSTVRQCEHATQVLGHWRKLSERQQTGHDREGNEIKDFTWIKSYIRGKGDIVYKHHVIV